MTGKQFTMYKVLGKRHNYLTERIDAGDREGRDFAYDKAERQAIRWAMTVIETCDREGILEDLDTGGKNGVS